MKIKIHKKNKADKPKIWTTVRAHFNETGDVIAFYEPGVQYHHVPMPWVEISVERYNSIRQDGKKYMVLKGEVIERQLSDEETTAIENSTKAERINQIYARFDKIDLLRIRPLAEGGEDNVRKIAALNDEAQDLRNELTVLENRS
jgi:hypothetical protein